MKKLIIAGVLVVAATSAAMAQGVYAAPGYGGGYYDSAPGYGYGTRYGYRGSYEGYGYGRSARDDERGGPGPRVGPGSGMGIGSQR